MRVTSFFLLHFIFALITVAVPRAGAAYYSAGGSAALDTVGLTVAILAAFDLAALALTLTKPRFVRWITGISGALLGIAALIAMAEAYVAVRLGLDLNSEVVVYGTHLLPVLAKMTGANAWWALFGISGVLILFIPTAASMRVSVPAQHSLRAFLFTGASAVLILTLATYTGGQQRALRPAGSTSYASAPSVLGDAAVRIPVPQKLIRSNTDQALRNVVVVMLETTKATATSPYNDRYDTSPFLDSLAREGLIAKNAYTPMPHTFKSFVSILCGVPPHPSISQKPETKPGGIPAPCLPELLGSHGYASAYFQPTGKDYDNREQQVRNMGFKHFVSSENLDESKWEQIGYGFEEKAMLQPMIDWIDKQSDPFFLSTITLSGHYPYKPPSDFPRTEYSDKQDWNNYLNSMRYADSFIEELYGALEERDMAQNTIFVVVGDHGEDFGNHIPEGHHQNVYNDSIRVPLVVHAPGEIEHAREVKGARTQLDIAPTIVDLLDMQPQPEPFYGQSLRDPVGDRLVYAMCTFKDCAAAISGMRKYITNGGGKGALYDLKNDPGERRNTLPEHAPDVGREFQRRIKQWRASVIDLYDRR